MLRLVFWEQDAFVPGESVAWRRPPWARLTPGSTSRWWRCGHPGERALLGARRSRRKDLATLYTASPTIASAFAACSATARTACSRTACRLAGDVLDAPAEVAEVLIPGWRCGGDG